MNKHNIEEIKQKLEKYKNMKLEDVNDNIVEKLSNYEHDRWSRWQRHLFSKCEINRDGSLTIPKEFVDRWTRQMNTKYDDLLEEEKKSDRKEAIRILDCLNTGVNNNE